MVRNIIRTVTTLALTGIITFGGFGVSGLNGIDNQPLSAHASQQTNQQVNPDTIGVTIDGVPVVFTDQQPIIVDGRTLVPVRGVFEALGFEVEWMPNWQAVWIKSPTIELIIPVGTYNHFNVNRHDGEGLISNPLDVKAQMINDRTMLPIRLPLEAVGFEVGWDDIGRNVTVTTNGNGGADATIANTTNSNVNNTNVTTASNPDTNADIPHWQLAGFPSQWAYDMFGSGLLGQQSIPPTQQPTQVSQPTQAQTPQTQTPTQDPHPQQTQPQQPATNPTAPNGVIQGLFTTAELEVLIANAPNRDETRSATTLPNRRVTDDELDAWIVEYHALGGINAFELEVIKLVNEYRAAHGLLPLKICLLASMAARFHSQDMTDNDFFAHVSPHHGSPSDRLEMFGLPFLYGGGENIGGGRSNPEMLMQLWLESPGHRGTLLRDASYIGVGAACGVSRGVLRLVRPQ